MQLPIAARRATATRACLLDKDFIEGHAMSDADPEVARGDIDLRNIYHTLSIIDPGGA